MKNYRMYATSVNERYIDEIADALRRGQVIIYPTDTLYAIGCDALNNRAVERVCQIKGINPAKQRLSMVCADISQASEFARIDNEAYRILRSNLPGPFTFILPASTRLSKAFKGRHEAGVRVPDTAIARAIAAALGNPVMSTSVGWSAAAPEDLCQPESLGLHYEGSVDIMVDGGEGSAIPSAMINITDPTSPELLREGPLHPRY